VKGSFGALVARGLWRALSDRTAIIGGLLAVTVLAVAGPAASFNVFASGADTATRAAKLRLYGWNYTSSFDFLMVALGFALGANQIAGDIKAGTLFGVLARPVSRGKVFLAGWSVSALLLVGLEIPRSAFLIGTASWLEGRLDPLHLLGALAVVSGAWLALASLAALGTVLTPTYAILAGLLGVIAGNLAFHQEIRIGAWMLDTVGVLLPLPWGQERIVGDALTGASSHAGPIVEVIAYRLAWTALLLFLGSLAFSRRDIAPRV